MMRSPPGPGISGSLSECWCWLSLLPLPDPSDSSDRVAGTLWASAQASMSVLIQTIQNHGRHRLSLGDAAIIWTHRSQCTVPEKGPRKLRSKQDVPEALATR